MEVGLIGTADLRSYSGASYDARDQRSSLKNESDGCFFIGTGTSLQAFFTGLSGSAFIKNVLEKDTRVQIKEVQDMICHAFSLNMSELATACQKSRKTLYDWRNGVVPRPNSAERLFLLYRLARNWLDLSNPAPEARLREPILSGKSLFELLMADEIDMDAIAFVRRRLDVNALSGLDIDDLSF